MKYGIIDKGELVRFVLGDFMARYEEKRGLIGAMKAVKFTDTKKLGRGQMRHFSKLMSLSCRAYFISFVTNLSNDCSVKAPKARAITIIDLASMYHTPDTEKATTFIIMKELPARPMQLPIIVIIKFQL